MDLPSLVTELQMRGLDQDKVDSALRCLVHVLAVQDHTSSDKGGILVEDIVNTYPVEVVQAASDLFLEKLMVDGIEVFRVKWGSDDAARIMERQLWDNSAGRWDEFVNNVDERYLGFFLPLSDEGARTISNWKLTKDLKWFSVEVPQHGWNVLRMMDDITAVAWKLDLAFGYRPYGPEGVQGQRVLLHTEAYASLKRRAIHPQDDLRKGIRLWKFFSEYDAEGTDFVALMKECDLTLDDVLEQVQRFFSMDLTSQYREGQYPPYFVNEKKKKEFAAEVRNLLSPMESWLQRKDLAPAVPNPGTESPSSTPAVANIQQTLRQIERTPLTVSAAL